MLLKIFVQILILFLGAVVCYHITPYNFYGRKFKLPDDEGTYETLYYEVLPQDSEVGKTIVVEVTKYCQWDMLSHYYVHIDFANSKKFERDWDKGSCNEDETAINFRPDQFLEFYRGLLNERKNISYDVYNLKKELTYEILFHKFDDTFPPKAVMLQCRGYSHSTWSGALKHFIKRGYEWFYKQVFPNGKVLWQPAHEEFRRGFYLDHRQIDFLLRRGTEILSYVGL